MMSFQLVNGFEAAFSETLGKEGSFSDDPNDPGGATKHGITERVARANGYSGRMEDLAEDEARAIAKAQYWDVLRLDDVEPHSIARELFDTGYNMGVGIAGQFLQRALNALNRQETDYADLAVDGIVGPMTLQALRAFMAHRGEDGETVMLRALNGQQVCREIELAERASVQERFTYGRILNRVQI